LADELSEFMTLIQSNHKPSEKLSTVSREKIIFPSTFLVLCTQLQKLGMFTGRKHIVNIMNTPLNLRHKNLSRLSFLRRRVVWAWNTL